ncbi:MULTISPECIES: hypothetical protein [Pseudofrankia]|uniref:hypothetical protein n=1 Tax=Pseudofrankia TaxID=2994363 RepID=UPI000234CD04|nr:MULTISPECIES: hypothetical protein [Pseudofrankia]OHV33377.1 hypothetical protein BCD49_27315 [Pseudofrankia sp. EUN1h]
MIDYWTHTAYLDVYGQILAGGAGPPELRDRLLTAIKSDPGSATLGALVDHLVWHADDDAELGLVRQASDLWSRALTIYGQVSAARDDVEAALLSPGDPASPARFNQATAQLVALKNGLGTLQAQITALHAALAPIPHLRRPHPRQESRDIASWPFADRFLARRTAAFLQKLLSGATDDGSTAFAAGAVSSYLGNAAGSAYLGAVVGGPRRLHRVRDRLARNTVGAWISVNRGQPSLTELAELVSLGAERGAETIPGPTRQCLEAALAAAYPGLPPAGDLDTGLRRMAEHLRLLDTFGLPPLPRPLPPALAATLTLVPGSPGGGVKVQSYGDDPNGPTSSTTTPTTSDKQTAAGNICLAILVLLVALLVAGLIICIGLLAEEGKCTPERVWEKLTGGGGHPPQVAVTAQTLVTVAQNGAGAELVREFAKAQGALFQGLLQARTFLATIGLIYPTGGQLGTPLFAQFTSTPSTAQNGWPRRSPPDEFDSYIYAPTSPVEQPSSSAPLPPGKDPGYLLDAVPSWIKELTHDIFGEPPSIDLDADRGLLHRCWDVAPGTRIDDQPLSVHLLGFHEI